MNARRALPIVGLLILLWGIGSAFASGGLADSTIHLTVQGKGEIVIKLYTKEAPKTTAHILDLVKKGFYNSQKFYRVEKTPRPYLVQFGAPGSKTKSMDDPSLQQEGTGTRIPYEDSGFSNDAAGVVGLSANQGDKNSGDAQFYILLAPAKFLDGNYTVFGKVIQGLDVLKKLDKGDVVTSVTTSP